MLLAVAVSRTIASVAASSSFCGRNCSQKASSNFASSTSVGAAFAGLLELGDRLADLLGVALEVLEPQLVGLGDAAAGLELIQDLALEHADDVLGRVVAVAAGFRELGFDALFDGLLHGPGTIADAQRPVKRGGRRSRAAARPSRWSSLANAARRAAS
jgi:hypothetical protein